MENNTAPTGAAQLPVPSIQEIVLGVILANIPQELKDLTQWVCWKYVDRGGKLTKCPMNPKTGGMASSTDSTTWADFETAWRAAANERHGYSGIGFVFSDNDPYSGVDLDDCRH